MASGRQHDRLTLQLSLPFALLWWPALGLAGVASALVGFLVGGLWLSPDLDTPSLPSHRWGPLGLLWLPYRRLLRHRSLLSHAPVLGTVGRLTYLGAVLLALSVALAPLGAPGPGHWIGAAGELWRRQGPLLLVALAGLEASAWLHLLQDGDPMPRRPRLLRRSLWRRRRDPHRRSRRGRQR